MGMGCNWRNPIRIPRRWRIAMATGQVAGPLALGILPSLIAGRPNRELWIALPIALLTIACALIPRVLELLGDPEKRHVDPLLEVLAEDIWQRASEKLDGPREKHRVTLFRVRPLGWFRAWRDGQHTHELVPCTRVPRSSRKAQRKYLVHEHYVEQCEGIAGLAYAKGQIATEPLPDLHDPKGVTDDQFEAYAKMANDSVHTIRQKLPYSRRIAGVAVYVAGERWGVLVLDSTDVDAISEGELNGKSMKKLLRVLTAFLEERS